MSLCSLQYAIVSLSIIKISQADLISRLRGQILGGSSIVYPKGVRWNLTDQACKLIRYRNKDYYHNTIPLPAGYDR